LYYNHLHGYDLVNSAVASERAVSLNPNDSWAHHQLGSVFVHSGLHDRAIKEYRSALQLDPMNDGAKYRLSRALWQAQRFQESIETYNRYNIKSIEEVLPLMYLGRRQQAWDLIAELTPQAGKPWRLVRDFPPVRALLYASEGKAQEAEREIQDAIRLGSKDDH